MADILSVERLKMLRTEIIESQKTQADFLKWKLIAVATVAGISLGVANSTSPAVEGAKLLLCLVPFICAYVDLTSLHIMVRVITIGLFLKHAGDEYEEFVFAARTTSAADPFVFEAIALHGSSIAFNLAVGILGFALPGGEAAGQWPSKYLTAYVASGGVGLAVTVFLWLWYTTRLKDIRHIAETRTAVAPGARN
jgi:hypothetical protein